MANLTNSSDTVIEMEPENTFTVKDFCNFQSNGGILSEFTKTNWKIPLPIEESKNSQPAFVPQQNPQYRKSKEKKDPRTVHPFAHFTTPKMK